MYKQCTFIRLKSKCWNLLYTYKYIHQYLTVFFNWNQLSYTWLIFTLFSLSLNLPLFSGPYKMNRILAWCTIGQGFSILPSQNARSTIDWQWSKITLLKNVLTSNSVWAWVPALKNTSVIRRSCFLSLDKHKRGMHKVSRYLACYLWQVSYFSAGRCDGW